MSAFKLLSDLHQFAGKIIAFQTTNKCFGNYLIGDVCFALMDNSIEGIDVSGILGPTRAYEFKCISPSECTPHNNHFTQKTLDSYTMVRLATIDEIKMLIDGIESNRFKMFYTSSDISIIMLNIKLELLEKVLDN